MAAVSAEVAKTRFGSYVINCYAPDEGNMHTLLHWGTDEQKQRYLKPMCEGTMRSCFAMTEPEVAGSDPTLMRTRAVPDGDARTEPGAAFAPGIAWPGRERLDQVVALLGRSPGWQPPAAPRP